MSQDYVTREELAQILAVYAKGNDVGSLVRETDIGLKAFLERTLQGANQELRTKVTQEMGAMKGEVSQLIATLVGSSRESIAREVEARTASLKDGVSHYLVAQAIQHIDAKYSELRNEYLNGITTTRAFVDDSLKANREDSATRLDSIRSDCLAAAKKVSEEVASQHVQSLQTQMKSALDSSVSVITEAVAKQFSEFRTVLDFELAQKVIDKKQIEQKIVEVEEQLRLKAQSVIEFQLEQARLMMEQSARSEVRDGVQASLQILLTK